MPAGTMELYRKKSRKRYTVIDENSIEFINQQYYDGQDIRWKYMLYLMERGLKAEDVYKGRYREYKDIYSSFPSEIRRHFHKYFFLKCEVIKPKDYDFYPN